MKKIFTLTFVLLSAYGIFAQAPEKLSYQAVIRNSSNELITNTPIGMRISILQGTPTGSVVYQEVYNPNPQTNENGLVNVEIGGGIPTTAGAFSDIDWSSGPYYLITETDPAGGTNYSLTGTSQILSVPYALSSKTSEILTGDLIMDASNKIGIGVPSPGNSLEMHEGEQTIMKLYNNTSGAGVKDGFMLAYNKYNQGILWNYENAPICFGTNDMQRMAIGADGNVGIGEFLSPTAFLHIFENSSTERPHILLTETESDYARISFNNTDVYASAKSWNIAGLSDPTDANSIFNFYYNNGTTDKNLLTFKGDGHVGIGTTNPGAGLHIKAETWPGSFIYLEGGTGNDAGLRLYEGPDLKWHIFNDASAGGFLIQNYGLITAIFCDQATGNVGIGTMTPGYKLTINGSAYCTAGVWETSDIRWKKNIKDLDYSISDILKLEPVSYELRKDEFPDMGFDTGTHIGLIAQDVEKVFPELVKNDDKGFKSVNYNVMIPVLLEAIREQQNQIDDLKKEVEMLKIRQ
jgi:hypothetical protein